jgi:hypothetical protein
VAGARTVVGDPIHVELLLLAGGEGSRGDRTG